MEEKWKEIEGYSRYLISNYGRVWSKTRVINASKNVKTIRKGEFKKFRNKNGYLVVNLVPDGETCKYKTVRQHRLIAEAFIPNPNNFKIIHHKNSVRNDNRIENLEWTTSSKNNYYRWQNKDQEKNRNKAREICSVNGRKNRNISLKTKIEIIAEYKKGNKTQKEIAKQFNLVPSLISLIVNFKYFKGDDINILDIIINDEMDKYLKANYEYYMEDE